MKLLSILLFGTWSLQAGAALIPRSVPAGDAHILSKRDVTWATGKNDEAKKSECSDEYKTILENTMPEVAKLAAAGSKGLALIQDRLAAISDGGKGEEWNKLEKKDQNRIRDTYVALYGEIKKSTLDQRKKQIKEQKAMLDKMAGMLNKDNEGDTKKNWPSEIRFFCGSSFFQDTDLQGNKYEQKDDLKSSEKRVFDTDLEKWSKIPKVADCSLGDKGRPAWTTPFQDQNQDRIVFCSEWFERSKSAEAGKSFTDLDPKTDIKEGDLMQIFHKKTGRMMLHEHMHSWTFMGQTRDGGVDQKTRLDDVESINSYGWVNAARLVQDNKDDISKPGRNIENLVFWCIAMFYDTWDWHNGHAATPSD